MALPAIPGLGVQQPYNPSKSDFLALLNFLSQYFTANLQGQVGANGMPQAVAAGNLPLASAKAITGAALPATAASNAFGYSVTLGTSMFLITEVANNSTATDNCMFEYIVPASYLAGSNLTLAVNASITIGSGTLTVQTLTPHAYLMNAAGANTMGANIASAGQNIVNGGSTLLFTITGTNLVPGSRLLIELTTVLTETSTHAVTGNINSVAIY
jgi:hypothetical protein